MKTNKIYLDFLPKITPKQLLKTTGYTLLEVTNSFFSFDGEASLRIRLRDKELIIKRYNQLLYFYFDGAYYRHLYYHNNNFYTRKELGNKYLLKSLTHKSRKAITTLSKSLKISKVGA